MHVFLARCYFAYGKIRLRRVGYLLRKYAAASPSIAPWRDTTAFLYESGASP